MPRKVKQKQKQRQKQSQMVIVNLGTRRRAGKGSQERRPAPPAVPQFVPYPVPTLRGPEPMMTAQPSLSQLLEALRPSIRAPVVPAQVPPPTPAPISSIVAEGKEEAGPEQVVRSTSTLVDDNQPMVDSRPRVPRPVLAPWYDLSQPSEASSSSASSLSSSSSSGPRYTYEELDKETVSNLLDIATELNITGRHKMRKSELVKAIRRKLV